ncbi:hypothetical protein PROFUN_04046 [Planoprotostelium fungivorum]|uniref:Maleylacetoacetate isomerase n=1 Tax=Planoprotostelium fungivorum TaxID=1890364 RepID=A0A2P6NW85_9EUKA|nr:hypothetical protein PROFUN_04046 [Planoprotostelium fungivorum]
MASTTPIIHTHAYPTAASDEVDKAIQQGQEYELFSYWRSTASWRVRIALAFKNIPHRIHPINLLKNEQQSEEYKKIHPLAEIPALKLTDGRTLTQSSAIIEYLEETHSFPSLLPLDAYKRAQVRAIVGTIVSDIHPIQNLRVQKKYSEDPDQRAAWAQYWISLGFDALEQMLAPLAGKYSVGDDVTMADVCLVPQVYNAVRWKVDMTKYPTIVRVCENLSVLPAFIAAQPSNQPDAPVDA